MSLKATAKEFVPSSQKRSSSQKTRLSAKASEFVPKVGSPPPTLPSPKFEVNGIASPNEEDQTASQFSKPKPTNGYVEDENDKQENVTKPPVKDRLRASGPILPRNSKPITITNTVEKDSLKLSIPKKKRSESFEEAESVAEKSLETSVKKYTREEIMSLRTKGVSAREKEIVTAISIIVGKASPRYSPADPGRRLNNRGGKPGRSGRGGSVRDHRDRRYDEMMDIEVKDLEKTENRYVVKKAVPPDEKLIRDLTAVLNKLTPEKFDKLLEQLLAMKIDTPERLRDTVTAVFEKALAEPAFSPTYAEFSVALSSKLQKFDSAEEPVSFKRLLLNKCQQEFEKDVPRSPTTDATPKSDEENQETLWAKSKRRMLATIQFIGELYARKLLNTAIMKQCIDVLLGKTESPEEEKLEALCKLLSTIGKTIDTPKNTEVVSGPFATLKILSKQKTLSSRIRFMIQDILDLRNDKWIDRRAKTVVQKKLSDFHKDESRKDSPKLGNRTPRGASYPSPSPRIRTPSARTPKGASPTGADEEQWEVAGSNTRKGRKDAQFSSPRRNQFSSPKQVGRSTGASPRPSGRSGDTPSSKKSSSRAVVVPGEKQKVSAGTVNSFSVLDGEENDAEPESTSPPPPSDRDRDDESIGSEEQPTPTAERKKLNLKKPSNVTQPRDTNIFFPEGSKPVKVSKKTNEVLNREKAEKQLKGILEEFLISEDIPEACLCTNEVVLKLPSDDKDVGLHLLISQGLVLGAERKDKDRSLLSTLFVHMYEEKILSKDDFAAGFTETLEIAEDLLIDFPKFFDFLASFFAKLVLVDAVGLSFLTTEATAPLKPADKEKLTVLILKGINRESPDKLVSLYKESELQLSSLLAPSTSLESLLKSQGLNSLISIAS